MPTTLEFECTIAAPLEKVWAFYDDPAGGLPELAPPEFKVSIESADVPIHIGSRIVLVIRQGGRPVRWIAKIVEHRPPHAVAFGEEARFVDEQERGPFKSWRHEHDFERIDEKTTRMTDRVTYSLPFGPLGWLADRIGIRRKLRIIFRHRHERTKALLEGDAVSS